MQFRDFSLVPLFFCLLLSLFGNFFTVSAVDRKDFVSLSLILDDDVGFESLNQSLSSLGFHNFTFVVPWISGIPEYWLGNATRGNVLRSYGNVIPRLPYLQTYSVSERFAFIDDVVAWFRYWMGVGEIAVNFMDFVPDTVSVRHLHEFYGCTYVQGYCFDQYVIDFVSMRGGWQLPYYSSYNNVMLPSDGKGVVVFPHVTWDWSESFYKDFSLTTHIVGLLDSVSVFRNDVAGAKDYWLKLIDRSLVSCSPFGFVSVQWEWCWLLSLGYQDYAFEWLEAVLENPLYTFWSYEAVAGWFNDFYEANPVYRVVFTSPFGVEKYNSAIEWYYDNLKRVCRYDGKVVSYVDYRISHYDEYRIDAQIIAWGGDWADWNCVDISLYDCIKIDALGGGVLRFEGVGKGEVYSGALADFGALASPSIWYRNPLVFGIVVMGICLGILIMKKVR